MNKNTLVNAIKSADVHKKTGTYIRDILKPGLSLKEIALLIENNIKKELLFDIMRTPEKRYGKEFFQAQLLFHKAGVKQFYMYTNYDAVNFVTRSVGEDFDNIVEFKNKRRSG